MFKHTILSLFIIYTICSNASVICFKDSLHKKRIAAWNENKTIISVGYGFPNYDKLSISNQTPAAGYNRQSVTGLDPIHAKIEYALGYKFSIGISFSYNDVKVIQLEPGPANSNQQKTAVYKVSFTSFLLRSNFHFLHDKRIDPYIGLGLGFQQYKIKYENAGQNNFSGYAILENHKLPWGFEVTAGLRFFVTKNIGIYMETGLAKSLVQGGLSVNIGRD